MQKIKIALGCDNVGFELKEQIKAYLTEEKNYEVVIDPIEKAEDGYGRDSGGRRDVRWDSEGCVPSGAVYMRYGPWFFDYGEQILGNPCSPCFGLLYGTEGPPKSQCADSVHRQPGAAFRICENGDRCISGSSV